MWLKLVALSRWHDEKWLWLFTTNLVHPELETNTISIRNQFSWSSGIQTTFSARNVSERELLSLSAIFSSLSALESLWFFLSLYFWCKDFLNVHHDHSNCNGFFLVCSRTWILCLPASLKSVIFRSILVNIRIVGSIVFLSKVSSLVCAHPSASGHNPTGIPRPSPMLSRCFHWFYQKKQWLEKLQLVQNVIFDDGQFYKDLPAKNDDYVRLQYWYGKQWWRELFGCRECSWSGTWTSPTGVETKHFAGVCCVLSRTADR